ncbi:MAG: serine/threonine-protein kinase [Kofleriaceae bacterium]
MSDAPTPVDWNPDDPTVDIGSGSGAGVAAAIDVGQRFGRFRVDGVLGAGGMGVVLSAHDPVLDRQVAIKVMSHAGDDTAAEAVEARMVREAKAMARLTHPNVVRVYEAGRNRAGVFLVMELVDGEPLNRWLETPRPWPQVIARFVAAGRGLAAAHAAGLVHRDFKPSNVLVSADGRVQVADFGLVSVSRAPTPDASAAADLGAAALDLSAEATLGTPRYMAPEQHQRGEIDPRTDQWAFCVALWEALYLRHPFAADSAAVLAMQVCVDDVRPPADERGVPAHLRVALMRGLARAPRDRHPSMDALLAALTHDPRRRRAQVVLAGGAVVLAGTAAFGWLRAPTAPARGPCDALVAPGWTAAERAAIAAGFQRAVGDAGADALARVEGQLATYAAAWGQSQAAICRGDRPASPTSLARAACLASAQGQVAALTDVLVTTATPAVVDGAVSAMASLPDPAACQTVTASVGLVSRTPQQAAAAATVEAHVRRTEARYRAGLFVDAQGEADLAVAAADASGDDGLRAIAALNRGVALRSSGDPGRAEPDLRAAAALAARVGDDRTVVRAWLELMWALGRLDRGADALVVGDLVAPLLARLEPSARERTELAFYTAAALVELGRYPDASRKLEEAIAIADRELPAGDPEVARILITTANVASYQGRSEEADQLYQRALAIDAETLGPEHPATLRVLAARGTIDYELGRIESSLARCQKALAANLRAGAAPSPTEQYCVGRALIDLGRLDEAGPILAAAVAAAGTGAYSQNAVRYLSIYETERGHPARALALIEPLLRDFDDHVEQPLFVGQWGRALIDLGRGAEARAPLVAALASYVGPARLVARLQFDTGRALWTERASRGRAVELVEQARATADQLGLTRFAAEIDAWQRAHRRP